MRRFLVRSKLITAVLLVYLTIMAIIGWPHYAEQGKYIEYVAIILVTLGIIIGLFFLLRRRDKMRSQLRRQRDASYRRGIRNDDIR
ncbi:MAG: hypothetical protein RR202_07140 [Bacteroidales bacterium]